MTSILNVHSEIGNLKSVLLHRPGREIENMTPASMHNLLFDDIPYAEVAMKEHDAFATTLRKNGVTVHYTKDLLAESLQDESLKTALVEKYVEEIGLPSPGRIEAITSFLLSINNLSDLCDHLIAGLTTDLFPDFRKETLTDFVDFSTILTDPMPNLYFMRDPLAVIGKGVAINRMYTKVRNRETLLIEHIFKHHPVYGSSEIPHWYDRQDLRSLEGGDVLVLSPETVMIGISQRTHPGAIECIADRLIGEHTDFTRVIAIRIPKIRAFMHLDTVLTQVAHDAFLIHPEIEPELMLFELTKNASTGITIREYEEDLTHVLAKVLKQDRMRLIPCAGGHPIHAPREQWNDGSNALCIKPGECIVYQRNWVTNDLLDKNGIKLYEIESSELSRGRGGPRCMSMPLVREPLSE